MLPGLTKNLQRSASKIVGALMLVSAWSAPWAAPLQDMPAAQPGLTHSRVQRATPVDIAAPALAMIRLKARVTPFDEPHTESTLHVEYRDLQNAADRGAEHQPTDAAGPAGPLALHWRESHGIVGPDVVKLARNYHRDGLPIVHLWQSDHSMLALGLNPHGVPGLYFTRHIAD